MKTTISGWSSCRAGALVAALALTATAAAQFVPTPVKWDTATAKESWASFSGASISVDGSDAAYQATHQHSRSGFYGLDELHWKQTLENDGTLVVDARALGSDNEYRLSIRYDNAETGTYVSGGWKESRVFYDASGGYLSTNDQWFVPFNPAMSLDRGELWLEAGVVTEKGSTVLRLAHQYRDGMKDSTTWGDSNLTGISGSTGSRYIVPAFMDIDETRNLLVLDVDYQLSAETTVGGGVRWENIETNDARKVVRRPGESAERNLTHRDETDSDLFALHGFTRWKGKEKLQLSAAAAHTTIDTNFSGSRIYGSTFDAVFDPTFARRQFRDEGYASLEGDSRWRQTLITANALYLPAKHWRVSGGLRFENQRQEAFSEVAETNVGSGPAFVTAIHDLEGESERHFDEILGSAEASYTGMKNVVWSVFAELASGDGNLREDLIEADDGTVDLARDTDFGRDSQKLGLNFRWYPSTSFNTAVGAYHKVRDNDYNTSDDTTPNLTGGDRYPAYIVAQKFATDDLYVRGTWRPVQGLSILARYDYQQSDIDSREDGLADVLSAEMTSHIIAGTVSWMPSSNLVLQGTINQVYDQIVTGAAESSQILARVAGRFDNNYRSASLLAMVAVSETTDIQVDASFFDADNFRNFVGVSMPYGLSATDRTFGISVMHRVSEDMRVGLRLTRADYDNTTAGGNRDFTADMIYGRLQMRF